MHVVVVFNSLPHKRSYSACLAIYYQLIVQYKWKEDDLIHHGYCCSMERIMHIVAIGTSLATAIVATIYNLYHEANYFCWISSSSTGNFDDGDDDDGNEKLAWMFRYVLGTLKRSLRIGVVFRFHVRFQAHLLTFILSLSLSLSLSAFS